MTLLCVLNQIRPDSFMNSMYFSPQVSNSENRFETKKNADKSTFFLSIICKKKDILSV